MIGTWSRGVCLPLSSPFGQAFGGWSFEVLAFEDPGPVGERVARLDVAGLGSQSQRFGRDVEERRRFGEIEPGVNAVR